MDDDLDPLIEILTEELKTRPLEPEEWARLRRVLLQACHARAARERADWRVWVALVLREEDPPF